MKTKNKRAQLWEAIVFLFIVLAIIIIIVGAIWIYSLFLNHGTSTDYAYNVEKSSFWNKLWLKDDHTTVYCFDDERFIPIIEQAQKNNNKIKVTYQEYIIRGFLCTSGSDRIGEVVITNIEEVKK